MALEKKVLDKIRRLFGLSDDGCIYKSVDGKMKLMAPLCFAGIMLVLMIPAFAQSIDNRDYQVEVRDIHTSRVLKKGQKIQ